MRPRRKSISTIEMSAPLPAEAPKKRLSRTVLAQMCAGIVFGSGVLYFSLRWAGHVAAGSQQGNLLAFLGSVVMVIPPVRLMVENWTLNKAASRNVDDPMLRRIQVRLGNAQVVSFMRFSWLDAISYLIGTLMLALGFGIQVLGWVIPL